MNAPALCSCDLEIGLKMLEREFFQDIVKLMCEVTSKSVHKKRHVQIGK